MPQDYMADDSGAETPEPKPQADESKDDTKTALLPIAFFQGKELKPGSMCSVRVESVQSDQAQVSYVPHQEEESYEATPTGEEDMMA